MSPTRDQEEATPLLIDVESSSAAATNSGNGNGNGNGNGSSGGQEETAPTAAAAAEAETASLSEPRNDGVTGNTPLAAVKRALFIMTCITLGLGVVQFVFGIATFFMNAHAGTRFNSQDWWMGIYFAQLMWSDVSLILFAILNIVFITKKGIFIHSLINMIVFSVAGLSVLAAALDGFTDRASDIVGVFYCDPGMGSPDSWYRGNFEECKAFRVQYAVISWIFLVFGFFNGLLAASIFFASLVKVYRERGQRRQSWLHTNMRPGRFSFEVTFRWGPDQEQTERIERTQQSRPEYTDNPTPAQETV